MSSKNLTVASIDEMQPVILENKKFHSSERIKNLWTFQLFRSNKFPTYEIFFQMLILSYALELRICGQRFYIGS